MIITSVKNPRLKQVLALRDKRDREETGLTRVDASGASSAAEQALTNVKAKSAIQINNRISNSSRGVVKRITN